MFSSKKESRQPVPLGTTVYDALPTLRDIHTVARESYPDIKDEFFWHIFEDYKKYTCLNVERFYNIFKSVEYIAKSGLSGDIAECGVFLGGSIIGAALFAKHFNLTDRKFFIFDTFEGFPIRTIEKDFTGETVDLSTLEVFNRNFKSVVQNNIAQSGLSSENFVLVEGLVEDTLPSFSCGELAYLRLDTDYYDSTYAELAHLYPLLGSGGVIILDDYGHFQGVRQATDDYFAAHGRWPLLQRVDYTGRCGIKV